MTKLYKELLFNYFNMYPQITIIFYQVSTYLSKDWLNYYKYLL